MASELWKVKHFTADVTCGNALELRNLLVSKLPNGYVCAFIANDNQNFITYGDKQFIAATFLNGNPYAFYRYTLSSGTVTSIASWGTGTGVVLNIGDELTVIYQ